MKVKVFRFRVSNASSGSSDDDKEQIWYAEQQKKLKTEEQIENALNKFIKDLVGKVIDIKVSTVDVKQHNNGRGNTVDLIYTVMYQS